MSSILRSAGSVALVVAIGFVALAVPLSYVSATGTDGDLMCIGDQCPVGMGPTGKCDKPGKGTIGKPCIDMTNGFPTTGVCVSAIPPKCQAQSANGKGVDAGLSKLGEILGQLMSKLMQGSGSGSGSGTGSTGTTGTTGTTCQSYYPVSSPSSDPCAYYVPPVSTGLGGTGTTTGGAGTCDTLSQLMGTCGGTPSGTGTGTTTRPTLSISPTSGRAPLSVTANFTTGTACSEGFQLTWGDGVGQGVTQTYSAPTVGTACPAIAQVNNPTHTYTYAGIYTATLKSGTSLQYTSTVTVNVSSSTVSGTGTSTVTNQTGTYLDNGPAVNPNLNSNVTFTTVGVGSTTMQVLTNGQVNLMPGVQGDIRLLNDGVTIVASTNDQNTNSTVAGFYGANTIAGQATGLVANLCRSRPWATNFLSFIIPPTFFDSLCEWRGYQVGTPAAVQATTQTNAPQTQTSGTTVRTQTQSVVTRPAVATSTTIVVTGEPKAHIWAVPAIVSLGSRTSIFWNSQGVTNCTETSPDGSFSQSSLSGGASTVPLTGATTFTMSCLAPDGSHVTDFFTVRMAI